MQSRRCQIKPSFFLVVLLLSSLSLSSQELTVFSGFWGPEYYQDDVEITKQEAKSRLLGYSGSEIFWRKKMTNETLFYVSTVVQTGLVIWTLSELAEDTTDPNIAAPLALLGSLIVNGIFLNATAKNGKKAILAYNKQFDNKQTTYQLIPLGNSNGFGFALKF